jgi:hypothetical protein
MSDLTRDLLLRTLSVARMHQAHYDPYLQPWGTRPREPTLGESIDHYRADLAVAAKKLLPEGHKLREVQYRALDKDAMDVLEPQLLQAVKDHAYSNDTVPEDAPLRQVTHVDPSNGHKEIRFIGSRSFVHDFKAPVRRVVSFMTDRGRYDAASGRWL